MPTANRAEKLLVAERDACPGAAHIVVAVCSICRTAVTTAARATEMGIPSAKFGEGRLVAWADVAKSLSYG